MHDVGPYTRVGRVADRENCMWASVIFERSGSIRVKKKATLTISEGSSTLRDSAELRLIDQRHQTGLKSMLCSKASATPFCQHLSRDFRSQTLSLFFLQVKKAERGLGMRLHCTHLSYMTDCRFAHVILPERYCNICTVVQHSHLIYSWL